MTSKNDGGFQFRFVNHFLNRLKTKMQTILFNSILIVLELKKTSHPQSLGGGEGGGLGSTCGHPNSPIKKVVRWQ